MEYSRLERTLLGIECLPQTNRMRLSLLAPDGSLIAERVIDFDEVVDAGAKASRHCVDEIMQLLKDASVDARQIVGIAVVQGAQRFTIARMIAVTANALNFALDIPVRDYTDSGQLPSSDTLWREMKSDTPHTLIHPRYTAEPRITLSKVL